MRLIRRQRARPLIPLSSMADIAFLLLVFFLVTSALRFREESEIVLPGIASPETVPQEHRRDLAIRPDGSYQVGEDRVAADEIEYRFAIYRRLDPELVVFVNADQGCPFAVVETALDALAAAGARRVVFSVREEAGNALSR